MYLYYSTRDSATAATMRLHGEVGYDILSSIFIEELNSLVADGVTDITVRINSVGGNVVQGYGLFSALLNCPAHVTTVNDGLAASTAGWLLLAGKTVMMADYALFMLHNPSTSDSSPKALEVLSKMRDSIITILAARTGQTAEAIGTMMDQETWLTAAQCLSQGFITEIVSTELLVALDPAVQNTVTMYKVVNSALGLGAPKNEAAPEAEVVTEPTTEPAAEPEVTPEPETPEVAPAEQTAPELETDPEPEPEVAEVTNAVDPAVQLAELLLQNAALTEQLNAYKQKEVDEAKLVVVNRAKELVKSAIATGKVTAAAENHWLTLATENHELAKSTLDALSAPARSTTSALNKAAALSAAPVLNATTTLRELEKKNPKEVTRLFNEDRVTYNQLYFNQYGKHPAE
jgi:ATP-dependent protease ClpP protease subunit